MAAIRDLVARFVRDEAGTAAIEYGVIAVLVSVPLIVVAQGVGSAINATFNTLTEAMK